MKEGDEEPPEEEHYVWNEGVRSDNEEVNEDDAELDFLFRGSINRDPFSQTDDDERTTESDGIIAFEPFSVNATDADSDREYSFFGQSVRTIFSTYAAWRAGRQKQKLRDVSKFLVLERIANHLANERTLLAWIRAGLTTVVVGIGLYDFLDIEGGISAVVFVLIGLLCLVIGYKRYRIIKDALVAFDRQEDRMDTGGDVAKIRLHVLSFVLVVIGILLFMVGWFAYRFTKYALEKYNL